MKPWELLILSDAMQQLNESNESNELNSNGNEIYTEWFSEKQTIFALIMITSHILYIVHWCEVAVNSTTVASGV